MDIVEVIAQLRQRGLTEVEQVTTFNAHYRGQPITVHIGDWGGAQVGNARYRVWVEDEQGNHVVSGDSRATVADAITVAPWHNLNRA